jgi:hypothetical protein
MGEHPTYSTVLIFRVKIGRQQNAKIITTLFLSVLYRPTDEQSYTSHATHVHIRHTRVDCISTSQSSI